MDTTKSYVEFYLSKLRAGDFETAFHSLREAGRSVIPILIDEFRKERDASVRAELVAIIWNHRQPETVGFLAEALSDSDAKVWRSALDGLVALASPATLEVLKTALSRQLPSKKQTDQFHEWVKEAITQITDGNQ